MYFTKETQDNSPAINDHYKRKEKHQKWISFQQVQIPYGSQHLCFTCNHEEAAKLEEKQISSEAKKVTSNSVFHVKFHLQSARLTHL